MQEVVEIQRLLRFKFRNFIAFFITGDVFLLQETVSILSHSSPAYEQSIIAPAPA